MSLAGMGRPLSVQESQWAQELQNGDTPVEGIYDLYLAVAEARFAPDYGKDEFAAMQNSYKLFSLSYSRRVGRLRRLLAWILPPLALALPEKKLGAKTLLILLLFFASGAAYYGVAQNMEIDPGIEQDELLSLATQAAKAQNWERAISLYTEGGKRFPGDIRFPFTLGNLYLERSLFGLAWDEFNRASAIDPNDTQTLQMLAATAGFLNRDREAAQILERLLEIDPDNISAISRLGWTYYKIHRLVDGERLLLGAIARFGNDEELAMTLGTIYAAMFRLEEGRRWYRSVIESGIMMRSFVSVAYYNLSVLESRFFNYGLAMDATNESIRAQRRTSGLLSRGELQLSRMEIKSALTDFNSARESESHETNPSPLPEISLAAAYLLAGRLEEARLYGEASLRVNNHAWMAYYGITPDRYLQDVHELLTDVYSGLANAQSFVPVRTPLDWVSSIYKTASYRFKASVHRMLFQKYSLISARAYSFEAGNFSGDEENQAPPPIELYVQFFSAFKSYPDRAALYLETARGFETAIIPKSASSYDLDRGILFNDLEKVSTALDGLDPVWQLDLISTAYREFALKGKTPAIRRSYAEELFALNPGFLLQSGIALPVETGISISGGNAKPGSEKKLRKVLAKTGFAASPSPGRYKLDIAVTGDAAPSFNAAVSLTDRQTGETMYSGDFPLPSLSAADIYDFAAALSGKVFVAGE
jgi:tetratricopeptide (TPR) repeat protein